MCLESQGMTNPPRRCFLLAGRARGFGESPVWGRAPFGAETPDGVMPSVGAEPTVYGCE